MLFSYFCHLRRLVFDQSSQVHPVSESRGGNLSVTDGEGSGEVWKSLCLILDTVTISYTGTLVKVTFSQTPKADRPTNRQTDRQLDF